MTFNFKSNHMIRLNINIIYMKKKLLIILLLLSSIITMGQSFNYEYEKEAYGYMQKGWYSSAIQVYTKAINDGHNAYFMRAGCYEAEGEYWEAIADYNYLIKNDWRISAIYFHHRGLAYIGVDRYEKACSDFNTALEETRDNKSFYDSETISDIENAINRYCN